MSYEGVIVLTYYMHDQTHIFEKFFFFSVISVSLLQNSKLTFILNIFIHKRLVYFGSAVVRSRAAHSSLSVAWYQPPSLYANISCLVHLI